MSNWKEVHQPCPCGKSSDAYCIDKKDNGYCFSCATPFNSQKEKKEFVYGIYPHRSISQSAFEKYDVQTAFLDEETPVETGFRYPNGAVKVRSNILDKKQKGHFRSVGPMKDAGCFGVDRFDPNGRVIIIVEGEYDCLATWDMTHTPTISPKSSSSARLDCKKDWDYINSFDKIIIAIESDPPGEKSARDIASLFDFHKVYRAKLTKFKDANDYLTNKSSYDFNEAIKSAKKYTPDNIINTFDEIAQSLNKSEEDKIGTYPFEGLQNALYGLHRGEYVVFKGPEGIGKTEIFRAIEHHLLKTTKSNIGIIHLEEDQGTTVKGISTYEDKYPYIHLEDNSDKNEILKAYRNAVGDNEGRVYIYNSFDVEDEDQILDNIRFLVSACNCDFIFLDHITWLATGQDDEDERRKLDRISQKLKLLAKELHFCVILITHTNDDGKARGSRNITKVANTVINLNRDKENLDEGERRRTYFSVEKGRGGGCKTGPAGWAEYNPDTLTLSNPERYRLPDAEKV